MNTQIANTYFKCSAGVMSKVSYTFLRQESVTFIEQETFQLYTMYFLNNWGKKKFSEVS